MMNALESTSTRPYLIRALYDWCTDNGLTPYVAVVVDETVQVPREYVKNGDRQETKRGQSSRQVLKVKRTCDGHG